MTEQLGEITELWRFPVKSMQGERVDAAAVTENGLAGDRAYAVVDAGSGQVGSAKHPRLWGPLLQCQARYLANPEPGQDLPPVSITLPDGTETSSDDRSVDQRLSALFARPVRLTSVALEGGSYQAVWPDVDGVMPDEYRAQIAVPGEEADGTLTELSLGLASPPGTFFDVAALHILTLATLRRLGEVEPGSRFTVERYRPNIVVEADSAPFSENGWSGATIGLGRAGLSATVLIPTMRCIMTTLAQGDLPRDNAVLRAVARHNRIDIPGLGVWSCVGAYASVSTPGSLGIGDEMTLLPA